MKSNKLVLSAILTGILAATSAYAANPNLNVAKLPNYVPGKATLTQAKLIQGTPCAGINFKDLESRIASSVAQHGSSIVPVVLTTVPLPGVTPKDFALGIQTKWHSQGMPDNAVVVVMQCTANGVYAATVPDASLVPYVNVQQWLQTEAGYRATVSTAPGEYAFNVLDWMGGTVQASQVAMAKASQVAQANTTAPVAPPAQQYIPQPPVEAPSDQVAVPDTAVVTAPGPFAPANPVESSVKAGVPTWVWVVSGLFGLGLVVFVVYRLVRRPDEEDVVTSNLNNPVRPDVGRRELPLPRNTAQHRPVHHTPAQRTVVHSGPTYNYGFGGHQVVVVPADVAYYSSYAPAWTYGYDMAWNIATMIGIYESLEFMYLNGEMNRALALGYMPGLSRDIWMQQQMATLDPSVGYYEHPLMQDSGWTSPEAGATMDYNPLAAGDTVDAQNAANGWEDATGADATLGHDQNPLAAGDDVDPQNAADGWEDATGADATLGHDENPLASGDDDSNPLASGDDGSNPLASGDEDDSNPLASGDNNDWQVAVDDEPQAEPQDDGYQVAVDDEPQAAPQDDGWQVNVDDEPASTGNDDYQEPVYEEPAQVDTSDDFQVSSDPEPDFGGNDDFSVDVDTSTGGDDNWS